MGGGKRDGEEEWKPTAVYHFGSKKCAEVDELSEFDFGLPAHKFDRVQCDHFGLERNAEKCGHRISPACRVATEGNDIGRRFLGCPYEDIRACSHVQWIDPEWKGREKTVICDLARKNKVLENQVEEKELEKKTMREKHNVEKKMLARIHREQLICRDRMLVFAVCMFFVLCAILFAVASKN